MPESQLYFSPSFLPAPVTSHTTTSRTTNDCKLFRTPTFSFVRADYAQLNSKLHGVPWSSLFLRPEEFVPGVTNINERIQHLSVESKDIIDSMLLMNFLRRLPNSQMTIVDYNILIFYYTLYDVLLECVPYEVRVESRYLK